MATGTGDRLPRLPARWQDGGPIDRTSADDLVSLATDRLAPTQVGAVLTLDSTPDVDRLVETVAARAATVPRLRRRLWRAPFGCGRPVWVDDPDTDPRTQVAVEVCPAPGDEAALLAVATRVVFEHLPWDRPLWRMAVVTELAGGRCALVVAFHHVLADGIGGLAVLAHLVDGVATADAGPTDAPPAWWRLAADAWARGLGRVAHPGQLWERLRSIPDVVRPARQPHAAPSALNGPTGPTRRLAVTRVPTADVLGVAHSHGATVNDVVLTAVAGALRARLLARGEDLGELVVTVPVSVRADDADALGNRVDVLPVAVPTRPDAPERLDAVAARTRDAKRDAPDDAMALLGPAFRLLGRLGVLRWLLDRQHMVHTFVTNLHGPDDQLRLLGVPVADAIAVSDVAGNVAVATAVLSYAGTLAMTTVADPSVWPDAERLSEAIGAELRALTAADDRRPRPQAPSG